VNRLSRKVDGLVSVSEVTKGRFLQWAGTSGGKVFILPNAVDLKRFGPGPKNAALQDRYGLRGRRVLLTVARLSAQEQRYKGIDQVIEVLPELAKQIPNLTYLLAGDGSDRVRLELKAVACGVRDRVVFAGRIPEDEKADHYRLADAFVMAGWCEGFGIVYLEALACGVPVVGSKVDGSRETLRDGALGVLVDPTDNEEILQGILKALHHPRQVPPGLDYFSIQNFEQRSHDIVNALRAP
jgi:glycosyltransferase involved in cell wall biosynthesis